MKTRILSAIVMFIIFVPFLVIGGTPFAILMTLLALMGLYELIRTRESKKEFPFLIKVIAYLMTMFFCLSNFKSDVLAYTMDFRVVSFLIFFFLLPLVFINDNKKYNLNDALFLLGSLLFIGFSFNLLILIRNFDLNYAIYLFLITTITDTFALVTGSLIGRHRLAEKISPKKTVEGLVGGVLMGTFVACMFFYSVIDPSISLTNLIVVTLILSVVGQLGDLVFSSIKRYYDKKDFSHLIPGHGGVLDRFDSMIFVVLAFVLFLSFL